MARDVVAEIRRATRRKFRAEDKIRIVLEGLRWRRVETLAKTSDGVRAYEDSAKWIKRCALSDKPPL